MVRYKIDGSCFGENDLWRDIEAANAVLEAHRLEKFALIEYLPAEPFVAWIEKWMKRGRQKRRERKLKK